MRARVLPTISRAAAPMQLFDAADAQVISPLSQ